MPRIPLSFVKPIKKPDTPLSTPLGLPAPIVTPTSHNCSRPRIAPVIPFKAPSLDVKTPWVTAMEPSKTVTLPTTLTLGGLSAEYAEAHPSCPSAPFRDMLLWVYQRMKTAEYDAADFQEDIKSLERDVARLETTNGGLMAQVRALLDENRSLQVEINILHTRDTV